MNLRTATPDDLDVLLTLAVAFYEEDGFTTPRSALAAHLPHLIGSDAARVTVAADGAQVAGFGITTTRFGLEYGLGAELEDLYVSPAWRRQGLAKALIEDSAAWAASIGASRLEIVIAPNGQDVGHLFRYYAANGFTDEGRRLLSRPL
ncbi:GNAT family N-acetyltransferase [Actinoplanes sp. NPDC051411]|uniref:GNAT family N-acetyltransferase n=1 Tax=Actinoplanes sp. NPDC051411 TaxID=3155522 RepID=UPI00343E8459